MFSHVMVGTNDIERARRFYDALLGVPGAGEPIDGQAATIADGATIGFKCSSPEQASQFHDVAVAHGGTSIEQPPGLRQSGNAPR